MDSKSMGIFKLAGVAAGGNEEQKNKEEQKNRGEQKNRKKQSSHRLKEKRGSAEHAPSPADQIEQKENKIKDLEEENRKLREGQKADFAIVMELLEPERVSLFRGYINSHAALPYADLLPRWVPALQELIGLAHALNVSENVEPQIQQMRAEIYLQRVRQMRLDITAAERVPTEEDMEEEWKEAKEDGLTGCVQWWLEKERATRKASFAISRKKLMECLRPKLQEIRELKPEDYLSAEGKRIICGTARLAEDGLREVGYFPEFYDSESTRKQIGLQPELDAAYNEGNSFSVEVPAVFLRREGGWELLSGCVGLTSLRKLNDTPE